MIRLSLSLSFTLTLSIYIYIYIYIYILDIYVCMYNDFQFPFKIVSTEVGGVGVEGSRIELL